MGLLRVESHSRFPKDARSATPCLWPFSVPSRAFSVPSRAFSVPSRAFSVPQRLWSARSSLSRMGVGEWSTPPASVRVSSC